MKVLVTGAAGAVGVATCRELLRRGHRVIGIVRGEASIDPALRAIDAPVDVVAMGDIGTRPDWSARLSGVDVVVHMAARAHVLNEQAQDPLAQFRMVNTAGTLHLADQCANAGVRRFVFISSIGVNGRRTTTASFSEASPPDPHDPYSVSKFEAERALVPLCEASGMELVIVRPPLIYGPRVRGNFAQLLKWVRRGIPLPLGAVDNRRSLVAMDNLVDFVALCADPVRSSKAANQLFLISDGDDVSTTELLRRVARAYDTRLSLLPVPPSWLRGMARLVGKQGMADRLLDSLVVDSTRARESLGWRPVVTMAEQMKMMAEHDSIG